MTTLLLAFLLAGDLAAAEKALAENRPREALELLGDLADADDADVRALLVSGRALLRLAEYEAAAEPLLRALEKTPEDRTLMRDVAWAYWGASRGGGTFAQAYLEDALRYARRAEETRLVADLLYDLQRWEEALAEYRKLPDDDATRLLLLTRRAHCLAALERTEEARAAYGRVLDEAMRRSDLPEAYRAAFRAEQTGKLLAWLDKRVAAEPEDVNLRLHRGYAREALAMWKGAVEDLREVVRLRPDHTDAHRRLARALVFYGSKEQLPEVMREAEGMLRANLDADPSDEMSWSAMQWLAGWAWANGDTPRAYDLLAVMLAIDPNDRDIVLSFAAMARRLGKYDEADRAFRTALEDDPEDPDLLNDYAILEDGRGNEDRAIELWRRVLSLDPTNRNALENLFTKSWERGDAAAMADYLKRGLAEAEKAADPALLQRWRWFQDRLRWAPSGFQRER